MPSLIKKKNLAVFKLDCTKELHGLFIVASMPSEQLRRTQVHINRGLETDVRCGHTMEDRKAMKMPEQQRIEKTL